MVLAPPEAAVTPSSTAAARGVWWLSPAGAAVLVVPLTLLLAWRLDDAYFRRSWGTAKALTDDTLMLLLTAALVFALGALVPLVAGSGRGRHAPPLAASDDMALLRSACVVLYRLTVLGYVSFLVVAFVRGARPSDLLHVLTTQDASNFTLRTQLAPLPGLTTLTQLGIAYVVVALIVLTRQRDAYVFRRLLVVFLLGLLRAFFMAERLAILELAIPACALLALNACRSGRRAKWWVGSAPFMLIPGLVAVFGLFEYSRSWVYYSQYTQGSFVEFVVNRLAGYYVTAYNNGALSLMYDSGGSRLPYSSVEVLWSAPGVSQLDLYGRLTGHAQPNDYASVLQQHGNPEFNSPGGLLVPFVDYGTVGGLAFFFLAGLALAFAYRRWVEGALWASLVYPVALTGVFELPRYLYWGQGRAAPAFVALGVIAWLARQRRRAVTRPSSPVPPRHVPNDE